MTWNPTEVDARIILNLVIANTAFECLDKPFILNTGTMVVAQGIVNDTTVRVDINITFVIISAADFNAHADRNSFTNVVGRTANSSAIGMNMLAMIICVVNNNPRARRAGVWLSRTVSEHISSVGGQTLNVSRNNLPSSSFL